MELYNSAGSVARRPLQDVGESYLTGIKKRNGSKVVILG